MMIRSINCARSFSRFVSGGGRRVVSASAQSRTTASPIPKSQFQPASAESQSSLSLNPTNSAQSQQLYKNPQHQQGHAQEQQLFKAKDQDQPSVSLIVQNIQNSQDLWKATEYLECLETQPSRGVKSGLFLDETELGIVVNQLFEFARLEKSDIIKKQILHSVGFQKLCQMLRIHSRWLDPGELITSSKLLIYLGTPPTHPTLQFLLRILSKLTHKLSCQEVIYLNFLLGKLQSAPRPSFRKAKDDAAAAGSGDGDRDSLISALQIALPIVFENQILTTSSPWAQGIRNEPAALLDCLSFAIRYNPTNSELLGKILGWVQNLNLDQFSGKQGMMLIWSLLDFKFNQNNLVFGPPGTIDKLLGTCLRKINAHFSEFTTDELSTLVTKLANKYPHFKGKVVIEGLDDCLDLYCQRLGEPRQTEGHILYSMRHLSILRHLNIEFLDHGARTILEHPAFFLNHDPIFYGTVRCYSNFNYKPPNWDQLKSILLNHPVLTKELTVPSIPFTVDLLSLDIFPREFITKLFSVSFHTKLVQYVEKYGPTALILIYNALKGRFREEYESIGGPWPPESMIQSWYTAALKIPKAYELKDAIVAGIGGEAYVLSGLWIDGFHIDHAIVMRKGGYPVSLDKNLIQEPILYSDLLQFVPPESEIILIKALFDESYANNTPRLRGISALELDLIQKFGHPLISVSVPKWKDLGQHERIPWLMEKIREQSTFSAP